MNKYNFDSTELMIMGLVWALFGQDFGRKWDVYIACIRTLERGGLSNTRAHALASRKFAKLVDMGILLSVENGDSFELIKLN